MADLSKLQLPNGTTYDLKDGRLPVVTSTEQGKFLAVNGSGEYVTAVPPTEGTEAYVQNTTLYIVTGITNGDEVGY